MKAFLVGLGLGALVGVAYAPRAGRETRRELEERARQSLEGANERVGAIRERVSGARERMSSAVQEVRRGVQSVGRQAGMDIGNEAQAGVGRVTEKAAGRSGNSGGEARDRSTGGGSGRSSFMEVINEWSEERLIAIHGIGPVLASKIIKNRPYEKADDLVESKELPPSAIEALRKAS
jgi:gas vesicle protein